MQMRDLAIEDAGDTMSAHLRAATAMLHARVERLLGLPDAIRDHHDYAHLLQRFLGLYHPIERSLHAFGEWPGIGIDLAIRNHSDRLARDLLTLGMDPEQVLRAPTTVLPDLPSFSHALGALYVLEGSTLGGRIILRALEPRLGSRIAGATRFFNGHGAETGSLWQAFRAALDDFEHTRPWSRPDVRTGAERLYRAILTWFPGDRGAGNERS